MPVHSQAAQQAASSVRESPFVRHAVLEISPLFCHFMGKTATELQLMASGNLVGDLSGSRGRQSLCQQGSKDFGHEAEGIQPHREVLVQRLRHSTDRTRQHLSMLEHASGYKEIQQPWEALIQQLWEALLLFTMLLALSCLLFAYTPRPSTINPLGVQ